MENNFLEFNKLLAIKFTTKLCVFQPSRSKTVGEDTFLTAKSSFFRREKHIKKHEYELYVKYIT